MRGSRERFEAWYIENAFDYEANPIGSRECAKQWQSWQAAELDALERAVSIIEAMNDNAGDLASYDNREMYDGEVERMHAFSDAAAAIRALAGKE